MAADQNKQTSHEKVQEAQNGKPVFALVPFVLLCGYAFFSFLICANPRSSAP